MPQFVEVSVNITQIDQVFHYHLPPELQDSVHPGSLVTVPFGAQIVQGVVLALVDQAEVAETKAVESVWGTEPVLTPLQLALAQQMAEDTLSPLSACVAQMIPPGLSRRADILVSLNESASVPFESLSSLQKAVLTLITKRGELRGSQLEVAFRHLDWRKAVSALGKKGVISTRSFLPAARMSAKTIRTAQLAIPPQQVDIIKASLDLSKPYHARRMAVLHLLAREPLPVDFSWIYAQTGAKYSDLKHLVEEEYILFNETEVWRDPLEEIHLTVDSPPTLTPDQQRVWDHLKNIISEASIAHPPKPQLIHGVTGSGKTELYLRAVAETLARGKQAIILVPEIALTPQTVRRFMARFPNRVGIYHSRLSEGERYDTWRRAKRGLLDVIIGARSALFMPLPDIGLVVLDECDNDSYDQSESLPYYHAVDTAEALTRLADAVLILGSATPRISQYYQAQIGNWELQSLPLRVYAHRDAIVAQAKRLHVDLKSTEDQPALLSLPLPQVSIVDMRQELRQGNRSVFSLELQHALRQTLDAQHQAILFLNRKGSATYVFCRECGAALKCPRDERSLIYHASRQQLLCHTCGYTRKLPDKCPQCGSRQIRQLGTGTEKLAELTQALLPDARILRWDADTTTRKGAHDLILSHFSAHRADILIGTQILAKGLDLPLVTLVGIVLAEVGFNLPDYRATERSFQLLTQVAGRAGRSPLGGRVILQSYIPENEIIRAAAKQDYEAFYALELANRRELNYPPFTRLVRLEYRHAEEAQAERNAVQMADHLKTWITEGNFSQTQIMGPLPCFYRRAWGNYRWQIVLSGPDPRQVLEGQSLPGWLVMVDPPDLL